ncbi:MAG: archaeal heat shock protein Hsp20, partial [Candidatus Thorarchaeota archaeon]
NEDDEDDEGEYNDFFNIFKGIGDPNKMFENFDPAKLFNTKEFQKAFQEIFKQIVKNLPKEFQGLSPEEMAREFMKNKSKFGIKGPIMYGFNMGFGPDGKPIMNSFGNLEKEPISGERKVRKTREPLVEVNEEEDQIILIAEMPGVNKDDIELNATNRSITISTEKIVSGRSYFKEIELPAAINSDYAKARYTNGILEVKLKKLKEKGKPIDIE